MWDNFMDKYYKCLSRREFSRLSFNIHVHYFLCRNFLCFHLTASFLASLQPSSTPTSSFVLLYIFLSFLVFYHPFQFPSLILSHFVLYPSIVPPYLPSSLSLYSSLRFSCLSSSYLTPCLFLHRSFLSSVLCFPLFVSKFFFRRSSYSTFCLFLGSANSAGRLS